MSRINHVEITRIETSSDQLCIHLTNGSAMTLDHNSASEIAELVFSDIKRLIHYREKQRNSVRNYYDTNLRKKAKK